MLNFDFNQARAEYYGNIYTRKGNLNLFCKPENLVKYQTKLAKPPKGGTRQSAEKRRFPKHADDLRSTDAYVRAYLRLNSELGYCEVAVAHEHWILNTAPTTWPEGPDCIATIEEE